MRCNFGEEVRVSLGARLSGAATHDVHADGIHTSLLMWYGFISCFVERRPSKWHSSFLKGLCKGSERLVLETIYAGYVYSQGSRYYKHLELKQTSRKCPEKACTRVV